jgi:hypothetical protein
MIRPPDPEDLKAFATRVVGLLESTGIPYAVCGSLAAMEYSEPRLSIDCITGWARRSPRSILPTWSR